MTALAVVHQDEDRPRVRLYCEEGHLIGAHESTVSHREWCRDFVREQRAIRSWSSTTEHYGKHERKPILMNGVP